MEVNVDVIAETGFSTPRKSGGPLRAVGFFNILHSSGKHVINSLHRKVHLILVFSPIIAERRQQ